MRLNQLNWVNLLYNYHYDYDYNRNLPNFLAADLLAACLCASLLKER